MKMRHWLVLAGMVVMCGCGDDARQRKLEQRVAELEEKNQALSLVVSNVSRITSDGLQELLANSTSGQSNYTLLYQMVKDSQSQGDDMKAALDRLIASFGPTNKTRSVVYQQPAASYQFARPTAPVAALKEGIPVVVYDQIVREAETKWPGNYEMQNYHIDNQVAEYKKIQSRK